MYKVSFSKRALKDLRTLEKSDPVAFSKAETLITELFLHPYTGTGRPKPLGYDLAGFYSRRISYKHRLVYSINDDEIAVFVISAAGHYNDH